MSSETQEFAVCVVFWGFLWFLLVLLDCLVDFCLLFSALLAIFDSSPKTGEILPSEFWDLFQVVCFES